MGDYTSWGHYSAHIYVLVSYVLVSYEGAILKMKTLGIKDTGLAQ